MRKAVFIFLILVAFAPGAFSQTWAATGTSTLSVNVQAEAAVSVGAATAFANTTPFGEFSGTTSITYKIRSSGTAAKLTVILAEFSPTTGPVVADLRFTSSGTLGTGVSTATAVSKTAQTTVLTFADGAKSPNAGATATVSWTLPDNPQYTIADYEAVATFTISAT